MERRHFSGLHSRRRESLSANRTDTQSLTQKRCQDAHWLLHDFFLSIFLHVFCLCCCFFFKPTILTSLNFAFALLNFFSWAVNWSLEMLCCMFFSSVLNICYYYYYSSSNTLHYIFLLLLLLLSAKTVFLFTASLSILSFTSQYHLSCPFMDSCLRSIFTLKCIYKSSGKSCLMHPSAPDESGK